MLRTTTLYTTIQIGATNVWHGTTENGSSTLQSMLYYYKREKNFELVWMKTYFFYDTDVPVPVSLLVNINTEFFTSMKQFV